MVVMEAVKNTIEHLDDWLKLLSDTKPSASVAIINSNPLCEASKIYIRNKVKFMKEHGVETVDVLELQSKCEIERFMIEKQDNYTSVILQLPLNKDIVNDTDYLLSLINKEKDLDRLGNDFLLSKRTCDLPATAMGMKLLIEEVSRLSCGKLQKVLFIGFGKTTNRNLYLHMFDRGIYNCRVANSKTPKTDMYDLIEWADIIVSSTGRPESLWIPSKGKVVISPTIHKTEDGVWVTDLERGLTWIDTNKALGTIGQLTLRAITIHALSDAIKQSENNQDINDEIKIGGTDNE